MCIRGMRYWHSEALARCKHKENDHAVCVTVRWGVGSPSRIRTPISWSRATRTTIVRMGSEVRYALSVPCRVALRHRAHEVSAPRRRCDTTRGGSA